MPKVTRETPLTGKTEDGEILSEKEELFCHKYVETMGNGTQSALAVYDTESENSARQVAYENLRKPRCIRRISELLKEHALNDATVDSKLNFLIGQGENLQVSAKAIEIYNKMQGRYEKHNKQKSEITVTMDKKEKASNLIMSFLGRNTKNSTGE